MSVTLSNINSPTISYFELDTIKNEKVKKLIADLFEQGARDGVLTNEEREGAKAPTTIDLTSISKDITGDEITFDMNHPLAEKDLTFEVEILSVVEPEEDTSDDDDGGSETPQTDV